MLTLLLSGEASMQFMVVHTIQMHVEIRQFVKHLCGKDEHLVVNLKFFPSAGAPPRVNVVSPLLLLFGLCFLWQMLRGTICEQESSTLDQNERAYMFMQIVPFH